MRPAVSNLQFEDHARVAAIATLESLAENDGRIAEA
jgi:hypothetical protein